MIQKHRISTNIGKDQLLTIELKQDFDLLEILSLKFSQKEVYTSLCSDYGVVCGRISVNKGLGVPNAKVSIFIPLSSEDEEDPVISTLYPYKTVLDKNEDGYRYNLLPERKQHGGHEPTGTFPDQSTILNREEYLEVYEKYYKYTVKTNTSGDFMIWGVPVGTQQLHIDVDLSDMGCFSLRPYDFITQGLGLDKFKNTYTFKSSEDLDSLPQIVKFDRTVEVYPFWGNVDLCEIGITRTDFDLSDIGVVVEPKAYLIGGTYTDNGKNSLNKNCTPRRKMGRKCDLTTKTGKIEAIRFTSDKDTNGRPILEFYEIDQDIPDDGSFVLPLPMNTEYVYTDEFGENQITNDPNKGVATSACYRFRFSLDDSGNDRIRKTANYLVPNIREYTTGVFGLVDDKSYAFSTTFDDYPTEAVSSDSSKGILYNENGQYFPRDYFYRMTYNKVYTMSSFHSMYYKKDNFRNDRYLGIKEIVPSEEEDCSENLTPPVNYGTKNFTFTLLVAEVLLFAEHLINLILLTFANTVARVFHLFADAVNFWPIRKLSKVIRKFAYSFQEATQKKLYLINYPECEECNTSEFGTSGLIDVLDYCQVGTLTIAGSSVESPRTLTASNFVWSGETTGDCALSANTISSTSYFITNQNNYILEYNGLVIPISTSFVSGATITFNDLDAYFNETISYTGVTVRDKLVTSTSSDLTNALESGCSVYDIPYDENLVSVYYSGTTTGATDTRTQISPGSYTASMDISSTNITEEDEYELVDEYDGVRYAADTPSGFSEFSNGIFYIIPGSQTNSRLFNILKEYRRRKRVGKMFCGGIVNYSFIDNWLSGSLYFFQFKGKKGKYCSDVVRYVDEQEKYYYRSCRFSGSTWGISSWQGESQPTRLLGRPTTIVDLGPRDEFIKEICVDPTLDPNCSVSRSIGPTSFKSFGDILGLAINYRMDVSNNTFSLNQFFDNNGWSLSNQEILDGDILQLISINNEAGIDPFELESPRYIGYSYQFLDPDNPTTKPFFASGSTYGPLPITLYLDEDGERVRACLNEPGRLTESSQQVPFFLWEKGGTGFGPYNSFTSDNQSWYYTTPQVQPLQGMTYGYAYTSAPNDTSDQYLLLPMTNTFSGLTFSTSNLTDDVDFDVVSTSSGYTAYNTEYPGFTYLYVTSGDTTTPLAGTLYTRVGAVSGSTISGITITNGWAQQSWSTTTDFIIRPTIDYYTDTKQILSTPFLFYFGLKNGKTGLDKFIEYFGDKGAFTSAE